MATDGQSWEESLISDLRAHGGRASWGPLAGRPLLVLYSIGVKSGVRRRSILTFTRDGVDYVVAGTNNGAAEDPRWVANIHADPNVTFEVGSETIEAVATEAMGAERNRLWANHVRELPWFATYEEQATARAIPLVRLTPKAAAV